MAWVLPTINTSCDHHTFVAYHSIAKVFDSPAHCKQTRIRATISSNDAVNEVETTGQDPLRIVFVMVLTDALSGTLASGQYSGDERCDRSQYLRFPPLDDVADRGDT